MKNTALITYLLTTPWALMPERMGEISSLINWLSSAEIATVAEIEAAMAGTMGSTSGSVAVLPVSGIITQKPMESFFFEAGTSTEKLSKKINELANDKSISAIVLDVNSPGGSVYGTIELADEIYRLRSKKKIIAQVNSLAASAAYWIASSASEIYITPGGEAGSIGVWTAHVDAAEFYKEIGLNVTLISAGKYKVEGNEFGPLGADAKDFIQSRVNDYYEMFTKAVARNRKASVEDVKNGYGQGRVVGAKEAKKLNLVDGISSMDETLSSIVSAQAQSRSKLAYAKDRVRVLSL